jgi:hypothetical protein
VIYPITATPFRPSQWKRGTTRTVHTLDVSAPIENSISLLFRTSVVGPGLKDLTALDVSAHWG